MDVLNTHTVELDLLEIPFEDIPERGRALNYSPLIDLITGIDAQGKPNG